MERYFIATEGSKLRQDYEKWEKDVTRARDLLNDFKKQHGIESEDVAFTEDYLYIDPTEKDKETLKSALPKYKEDGFYKLKKNSKINKAWVELLSKENVTHVRKPMLILYFAGFGGGRYRTRLFKQNNVLYASIESNTLSQIPNGLVEIKASEFYKVMEETS